ncbi:hypothetical protein CYMTET_24834, partial [Cymbomonas tetramitiformis]
MKYRCVFAVLQLYGFTQLAGVAAEPTPAEPTVDAGEKLKLGDAALSKSEYSSAISLYSQAIAADPKAPLPYTKRAAAYLQKHENDKALRDLNEAVELDPNMISAYLSRGKLQRMMCRFKGARADFQQVLEKKPGQKTSTAEMEKVTKGEAALSKAHELLEVLKVKGLSDSAQLQDAVSQVLDTSPDCVEARILRAEASMAIKDYGTVVSETGRILKMDPGNMNALLLRGRSYFYLADHELSMRHFREALKFDPEHTAIKKEYRKVKNLDKRMGQAKEAFDKSQWEEAVEAYSRALEVGPMQGPCLWFRAFFRAFWELGASERVAARV